jgi:enamine deaminase RidA (YjgF/YER057c/UK114 family)
VPALARAQSEPSTGDIQIFRNPRESVAVFPRIAPVDKSGAVVAPDDPALQLKQALENLRRLAGRVGVLPAHFVTLTLYVKEKSAADGLEKIARESFSDWNPSTTVVETKELRVAGALVEVEAVAMIRSPKSGR